jgi:VanZ family protein
LQEIATLTRLITDMGGISSDAAKRSLAVRGTPEQVALADWLIHELDRPAPAQPPAPYTQSPAPAEYRLPFSVDNVVRVVCLNRAETPWQLQEIAAVIRSTAGIRRVFIYTPRRALALRATADQMALATWLIHELDEPANAQPTPPSRNPAPQEYRLPGDDVARVFYLTHPETPQQLQEIVTTIRSIADIRRAFIHNAQKAAVVRATNEQVALAAWLVNELDRPVDAPSRPQSPGQTWQEYRLSTGSENVVRVFHLTHAETPQQIQQIVTQIRATALVRRLFPCSALRAIVLRGTVSEVASAERVIEEFDKAAR